MKRVLVTGASGCVGQNVLPVLVSRGWDVHAVSTREMAPRTGVTWHRANLFDPAQLRGVVQRAEATHLLHLAWYLVPGKWASHDENYRWVQASVDLLRVFDEMGGSRFVGAGSCLEYDWSYGSCSEDRTPCQPHTGYGACKHAWQLMLSSYTRDRKMTSAWGRIFNLYGPYEHPDRLIPAVVRALLAGQPARCSHGNQIRDYLYAVDVAEAFVALLDSDVTGPINIADGEPVRIREMVMRAGELLGRSELIQLGAIPAAATDVPVVVADTARLHQSLGWRRRFDLSAGLTATIDWWRSQVQAGAVAGVVR
jgi:nucleoside-diphosphate-sugar epimerase